MRLTQITILTAICLLGVVQGDDFFEMLFGKKPMKGKLGASSGNPEESVVSSKTKVTTTTVESTDATDTVDAADATVTPEADAADA